MRSPVMTLGLVAVIGVVIGLVMQSPVSTRSANPELSKAQSTTPLADAILESGMNADVLSSLLKQEITARQSLEKKVTVLSEQIEKISASLPDIGKPQHKESSFSASPEDTGSSTDWFNRQALLDAGIDETEANRIKTQFEDLEMDKLYLRDRAVREGWSGDKQYREELKKLDEQIENLEAQLGEETYPVYLYAVGRSNRVEVQSVLSDSPAATAGIQTGDHILKYDNERIYNWGDLRGSTAKGTIGETVTVEVERDGKRLQIYVPRGPLGIRMNSVSVAP